jgi:hypothetical protein
LSGDIILRGEDALPEELSALLREPPPDGVWHLPGHPPETANLGFAQRVVRALKTVAGRSRHETPPLDDEGLEDGDGRFGLWLTEEHLLLVDDQGVRAARREDIVGLRARRVRRLGLRTRDLLVFELRQGRLYFSVNSLDGWAGRAEELRAEAGRRLKMGRARTDALEEFAADRQFDGFVGWLESEVRRLQPDAAGRAQLLELTAVALSSWPDETRRAPPDWFLADEADGSGRRGFARDEASWLLPLSRAATFEAASHFPDAASVADCALTFRNVPLTGIELDGSVGDGPFEALLLWAATKPLRTLTMTDANKSQQMRLADFKREHGIA